jgi:TPR repeat protein
MAPAPAEDPQFSGEPDLATRRAECDAAVTACAGFGRELERAISRAGGNSAQATTLNDETRGWLREARGAHVRACDAGVAQSCFAEASLARDALDRDARHVEQFYLRGCELGLALSCSYLAEIYSRGLASTVPGVRSVRFAGQPEIRSLTGIDDPKRPAIAKDLARSAEYYRRACGLGDRDGCRLEGMTLQESAATPADPTQARANEIFVRLCRGSDWSSCLFLLRKAEAAGGKFAGKSTEYWRTRACLFGGDAYCTPVAPEQPR